jgi:hypothetical protein
MKRVIVLLALMCLPALSFGDVVTLDGITVNPQNPTVIDNIVISTYGWIGYAFDIGMVDYSAQLDGLTINLDVYFLDSNPGGIGLPVADRWDITEPFGQLQANTYSVISRAWVADLVPFGYRLADMKSTTFQVIPEPVTFMLLGLGGLLLRKRRA